jgi:hypothetical protein
MPDWTRLAKQNGTLDAFQVLDAEIERHAREAHDGEILDIECPVCRELQAREYAFIDAAVEAAKREGNPR